MMDNTIVTYETFHGSAKKIGEIISNKLNCKLINIDTPFEAEDLSKIDNIILIFNFRGPYTAQLTKLYLNRVKSQLKTKNIILIGEGLFSEKEFPIVAQEINKANPSKTFNKFFVNGQLRMDILFPEEKALLKKFAELTKMDIHDMGELDIDTANQLANEILILINSEEFNASVELSPTIEEEQSKTKWVCPLCGHIYYGETPPESCPLCGAPGDIFIKEN